LRDCLTAHEEIKGLHENDFIMAAKINGIFERAEANRRAIEDVSAT
jgi:pterin-4a-carbinolamine dehydratase